MRRTATAIAMGLVVAAGVGTIAPAAAGSGLAVQSPTTTVTPGGLMSPAPADPLPLPRAGSALTPSDALRLGNPDGTITLNQAWEVVHALWDERKRALADDDVDAIDRLETGIARQIDVALAREDLLRHGRPSGFRPVGRLNAVQATVPARPGYPATFLAQVTTTGEGEEVGTNTVNIVVFTRRDFASPWQLALTTSYQGDLQYWEEQYQPPSPTWIDARSVHDELAAYWQHWKDSGTAPEGTLFDPGPWTTETGKDLARNRQDGVSRDCRCLRHTEYSTEVEHDGLYRFGLEHGEVVCSTVRIESVSRPRPDAHVLYQDGARDNWGGWLEPGTYRRIETKSMYPTCIIIRPDTEVQGRRLHVLGGYDRADMVAVTGVRGGSPSFSMRDWVSQRPLLIGVWLAAGLLVNVVLVTLIQVSAARRRRSWYG